MCLYEGMLCESKNLSFLQVVLEFYCGRMVSDMKLKEAVKSIKEAVKSKNWKRVCWVSGLTILVVVTVLLVLAEIASHRAAMIFNREMEKQDMLRGKITVEGIAANIKGDVVFENLLWVDPSGEVILKAPEGSFRVRPWDVITRKFKSTTVQRLELNNAVISVGFDENMQVDILTRKQTGRSGPRNSKPSWNAFNPENREANFNRNGKKLKCEIKLNNCRMGYHYRNRHYIMNNVNMKMQLDTSGTTQIDLSTGRFGGTMVGGGLSLFGSVDFKPKTPEMDIDVTLRDVDPDSLGFGIKMHDLMTLVAKMNGPVTDPQGRGTVRMEQLIIPGLRFTKVLGDVYYSKSVFRLSDVQAKVFSGDLRARGDYNLDTREYNIYGKATKLDSRIALNDWSFICPVDLELTVRCDGNPRNTLAYGKFSSGKGHYSFIHFDRLEGRFSNQFKELSIYDAKILTSYGAITTDAFSITQGRVKLGDIIYTDPETGKTIVLKKADRKPDEGSGEKADREPMTGDKHANRKTGSLK